MEQDDLELNRARQYSSRKYLLAIIDAACLLALLFLFLRLGVSAKLSLLVSVVASNHYVCAALFFLFASVIYYVLDFPLNIYRSFILEHKFGLTRQKLSDWLKDQLKAGIISYVIALIMLEAFYFILKTSPGNWWLIISAFWIFFSLVLARLMPIVIIPLFFKYTLLTDEALRARIISLAEKMKISILDVFEIDFSKKTLKANAAFVGLGRTKRVILADTLKNKYTPEEIEVILAHEFAHYRLKHLLKLVIISSLVIVASFYLIFRTSAYFLSAFGFDSLTDIAAMPVVLMYLVVFSLVTGPIQNFISRKFERDADMLALRTTGLKDSFASVMDKLASQNLSDRKPHPLVKFFFFDHPPIEERIAMAKKL